jgi:putative SOS response-associated peptidase YedK
MCGRFAVTTDPARLAEELDAGDETGAGTGAAEFAPNYNVAPTTDIAVVVARRDPDENPTRRIRLMRWGLLPPWVKADADGKPVVKAPMINARAETLTTSPAYRAAAEHKRCLVPMDGYYEWKPNPDAPKRGGKTPYFFYRADGRPLLVAGLWSVWHPDKAGGPASMTCTVVTTRPPARFAEIHDRMPLVLDPDDWDRWLDPDRPAPEDLLAGGPDAAGMAMREVSTLVNRVANNGPELIEPVTAVALF